MRGIRSWRGALFCTGGALVAVAATLTWFFVSVANPRLGSQQELDTIAAPPGFDRHDATHLASLLVTLADTFVARPLNAGIVIGVFQEGNRHTIARGVSSLRDPDQVVQESTLFEVGSIAKTFTGLALAEAVLDGEVQLEQPISSFLPDPTNLSPAGRSITLGDLGTHTSGLPTDPPSVSFLSRTFGKNPFGSVSDTDAFRSLTQVTNEMPPETVGTYSYSNFGFMLLGRLLEQATGREYAQLVEERVARVLGMHSTWSVPPEGALDRLATGHRVGRPVEHWYEYELPGAAGIVSTVPDLLTYVEAHLRPLTTPIPEALELVLEARIRASENIELGLGWHIFNEGDGPTVIYHNGATMGFRSYIGMAPDLDLGIVVLGNSRDLTISSIGRLLMRKMTGIE